MYLIKLKIEDWEVERKNAKEKPNAEKEDAEKRELEDVENHVENGANYLNYIIGK